MPFNTAHELIEAYYSAGKISDSDKAHAFDEISKLFYERNFGTVNKSEIELLMFSILMDIILPSVLTSLKRASIQQFKIKRKQRRKLIKINLPKYAKELTIETAEGVVINTKATSIKAKYSLVLNADIRNENSKPIAVSVPKNCNLTIGNNCSLGKIKGGKGSKLSIGGNVTALGVNKFDEVNISEGKTLTISGNGKSAKLKGVGNLNGNVKLDAKASAVITNIGNAEIEMVTTSAAKGTVYPKLTVTSIDTLLNLRITGSAISSGDVVMYSGKTAIDTGKIKVVGSDMTFGQNKKKITAN